MSLSLRELYAQKVVFVERVTRPRDREGEACHHEGVRYVQLQSLSSYKRKGVTPKSITRTSSI